MKKSSHDTHKNVKSSIGNKGTAHSIASKNTPNPKNPHEGRNHMGGSGGRVSGSECKTC